MIRACDIQWIGKRSPSNWRWIKTIFDTEFTWKHCLVIRLTINLGRRRISSNQYLPFSRTTLTPFSGVSISCSILSWLKYGSHFSFVACVTDIVTMTICIRKSDICISILFSQIRKNYSFRFSSRWIERFDWLSSGKRQMDSLMLILMKLQNANNLKLSDIDTWLCPISTLSRL